MMTDNRVLKKFKEIRQLQGVADAPNKPEEKQSEVINRSVLLVAKVIKIDQSQIKRSKLIFGSENNGAGLAYKLLRTKVYKEFKEKGWNSIGITSANPSEGKTTTTINLAYMFSRSVKNPIIIADFDLHRPNIHKLFRFSPKYGMLDYLQEKVEISEVIYRLENTNIYLIPGREQKDVSSDVLLSSRAAALGATLESLFPSCFIFYDFPPVIAVDDAVTYTKKDCNLVVASENETTVDDLHHVMEMLGGQPILGYVLNKSRNRARSSKGGYYYYKGYGYGYGSKKY